jgi:hypothetical protein
MKKIIFVLLCFVISYANAEQTLWDQMPKSMDGKYKFFEKNDMRGVYKSYKNMRGTRYIFACVNAQVYYLFANQQDWVKDQDEAEQLAKTKCNEIIEIPIDKNRPPMRLPLGTPILLRFEKDYSAYDGYLNSKDKWISIGGNDQAQLYISSGKQSSLSSGNKGVWILSNYDKTMEFASAVSLREVNCRERKFKINKLIAYSQKYGQGNKIQDYEGGTKWEFAPPDSLYESIIDNACR